MLSSVLKSERAVQVNVQIMRTFVRLREILATHADLAEKLCHLLENPAYAERLGRQAAVDSRRRYGPGLLAARSIDYYQRVIARARIKQSTSRTF